MKKAPIYLTLLLAIVIASACNEQQNTLQLKGTINTDAEVIYLQSFRNKMFFTLDSATINNGSFTFEKEMDSPELFGLTLNRDEVFSPWYVFLEPGTTEIAIDTADSRNLVVSGSASQELFEYFQQNRTDFDIDSFITQNPNSPVASYILYREYATQFTANELENSISLFDEDFRNHHYLNDLRQVIASKRQLDIGNPALDFAGVSPQGETIRLSEYTGNYLLLEFWASWCGPCRRDNPNLVKAYQEFHPNGFEIFAVSLDHKKENWIAAIEKDSLSWVHVSDLKFWDSEPAKLYGIRNIPSNVLIDPQGNIIARNIKGTDLAAKLGELYAIQP
jgi:peroxiredoxin